MTPRKAVMAALWLAGAATAAAQAPAAQKPDPSALVGVGVVETNRVASGRPFSLWITLENRTGAAVEGLHFAGFSTRGFQPGGRCWREQAAGTWVPACRADLPGRPRPVGLPQRLETGRSVTVTAELVRDAPSGTFRVSGVYAWRDPAGGEHQSVVLVGPIEVTRGWANLRAWMEDDLPFLVTGVVLPVLKDLAWPIVILLLGVLFRAGEQRRAAVQQTWTQMLSKSHANAERHYMPVSSAIYGWHDGLGEPRSEEQVDKCFYHFALLLRNMRELREDIGGFYFKDRDGEMVAAFTWGLLRDRFEHRFPSATGIEKAELLWRAMGEHETFHEFKERLGEEPVYAHPRAARRELWEVRRVFKDWIRDPEFQELELPLAKLLEETIDFEMNRPYEPWYKRPERFRRGAVAGLEKELAAWVDAAPAPAEPESRRSERRSAVALLALLRPYQRRNAGRSANPAWRWLVRLWWMVRLAGIWNWRERGRRNALLEGD